MRGPTAPERRGPAPMRGSLLITGAAGFIGTHLLRRLPAARDQVIRCLSRAARPASGNLRWVAGDLTAPASYAPHLDGVTTVIHLAAATGARGRDEYYRVNADGTARLLEACARAGVRRFLYVSSIAAKFDEPRYHYGRSKRQAEEAVRRSGLPFAIVRPTIVAGREGPAWRRLEALAAGPVTVLVGDGGTRVQPVHVDDVATALVRVLEDEMFGCAAYDLGGPEIVTIEDLIRRIRRARDGTSPRMVHLPYAPLAWSLSLLERVLGGLLPVNAGQLSALVHDGTIEVNDLFLRCRPAMRGVDEMLALVLRDG